MIGPILFSLCQPCSRPRPLRVQSFVVMPCDPSALASVYTALGSTMITRARRFRKQQFCANIGCQPAIR